MYFDMSEQTSLNIRAIAENASKAMDFVEAELLRCGFSPDVQPEILIAVEEVFLNIATYAYKPAAGGDVKLSVTVNGKAVIRFEDFGQPFNPLQISDPDLDVPIMEREIGGLGIHFVKNLMDRVEYGYSDGKNILTISKAVSKQDRVK